MVEGLATTIRIAIDLPVYRYSYEGNYALNVLKGVAGPEQNFEQPRIQFPDSLHFYFSFYVITYVLVTKFCEMLCQN